MQLLAVAVSRLNRLESDLRDLTGFHIDATHSAIERLADQLPVLRQLQAFAHSSWAKMDSSHPDEAKAHETLNEIDTRVNACLAMWSTISTWRKL